MLEPLVVIELQNYHEIESNATLKVLTLRSYPCTRILLLILSYYLTIETGQVLESRFAELELLVLCWNTTFFKERENATLSVRKQRAHERSDTNKNVFCEFRRRLECSLVTAEGSIFKLFLFRLKAIRGPTTRNNGNRRNGVEKSNAKRKKMFVTCLLYFIRCSG